MCLVKLLVEKANAIQLQQEEANKVKAALDLMKKASAAAWELAVFRFQPKHREPMEVRNWRFELMWTDSADRELRKAFWQLAGPNWSKFRVGSARSQDGPLTKWLQEWGAAHQFHRGAQGGRGGEDDEDFDYDEDGDTNFDGEGGGARRSGTRRRRGA